MIATESVSTRMYSRGNTIFPHQLGQVTVNITLNRPVGTDGKRMHIMIKVQDHTKKWHRLSIPDLKPYRPID